MKYQLKQSHSIFLVGLPGSGKTTIGKELAHKLSIPFLDTDEIIIENESASIEEIFSKNGENYFRELEKNTLHKLISKNDPAIISTGGGLPCFFDNMEQINKYGCSIFLNVDPADITERLWNQRDENRPMLKGKSKEELQQFLKGKLEERFSFYSQANFSFNGKSISAEEILKALEKANLLTKSL